MGEAQSTLTPVFTPVVFPSAGWPKILIYYSYVNDRLLAGLLEAGVLLCIKLRRTSQPKLTRRVYTLFFICQDFLTMCTCSLPFLIYIEPFGDYYMSCHIDAIMRKLDRAP